eukprot:CAMPEP_0197624826 /NCGR_PEP_ID=MMETSP1338-20131121/4350_1 /TAXON_ID=43686 ORGANISM="Pelagodinium beii, Strain RCC1491" /NCGR_SAMPLE_ID=MMETSP1338 /ASSEMBLY_ACC=CAM_ASM_000754 /LENGTH=1716 /DNA_ID=CAMNT_0043195061 /DNA_START=154 /DNA_END=5304 /DNA_ORIENTATION=+
MKKILVLLSFSVAAQAAEIINEARLEKLLDDSIELDGEPSSPSRPLLRAEVPLEGEMIELDRKEDPDKCIIAPASKEGCEGCKMGITFWPCDTEPPLCPCVMKMLKESAEVKAAKESANEASTKAAKSEGDIDCAWDAWNEWTVCQFTCGGGNSMRTRKVKQMASGNGKPCDNNHKETKECAKNECPIDCVWGEWSQNNACSTTCGVGTRQRNRSYLKAAQFGGEPCMGETTLTLDCNLGECPVDCKYSSWDDWGGCSKSCGGGNRKRFRSIAVSPSATGKSCSELGSNYEDTPCGQNQCPVDCALEDWGNWELCDASCGTGSTSRLRSIKTTNIYGGLPCGHLTENKTCDNGACPSDCKLSDWSDWFGCDRTCKSAENPGTRKRTRVIAEMGNAMGAKCPSESARTQSEACQLSACPVDCQMSDWSAWSECSATCGQGNRERFRDVQSAAAFGGKACRGGNSTYEKKYCSMDTCPVDCEWNDWQDWRGCSTTCGTGTGMRLRDVKTPMQNGGKECAGGLSQNRECNLRFCPVHCQMGDWTEWSTCTATCSNGTQQRDRTVIVEADYGGLACSGNTKASRSCFQPDCPIHCEWKDWTEWTTCSTSCGTGQSTRNRIIGVEPQFGGEGCSGNAAETKSCSDLPVCPTDCEWDNWNEWLGCSATCGTGVSKRTRVRKKYEKDGGHVCWGTEDDEQACTLDPCPIDCVLGDWSQWGACTATCGNDGAHIRHRGIRTESKNNGKECDVDRNATKPCDLGPCPVDCVWGEWDQWSRCSKSCNGGTTTRKRVEKVSMKNGGKICLGSPTEDSVCKAQGCPVDCRWEQWTDWSGCSATCGNGKRLQTRKIDIQAQWGGVECEAENDVGGPGNEKSESCAEQSCPTDCQWTSWTKFSLCSKTCDSGTMSRTRSKSPVEADGGKPCVGDAEEVNFCNTQGCPRDCEWSEWTKWTECSKICGGGKIKRFRDIAVTRKNGGEKCVGVAEQEADCNMIDCPVNCEWDEWRDWEACPVTCDGAVRAKTRTKRVQERSGGIPCAGNSTEKEYCNPESCPVDCHYLPWSDWGECSTTCGTGQRFRTRVKESELYGGLPCEEAMMQTGTCVNEANIVGCPRTTTLTTSTIPPPPSNASFGPNPNNSWNPKTPHGLWKEEVTRFDNITTSAPTKSSKGASKKVVVDDDGSTEDDDGDAAAPCDTEEVKASMKDYADAKLKNKTSEDTDLIDGVIKSITGESPQVKTTTTTPQDVMKQISKSMTGESESTLDEAINVIAVMKNRSKDVDNLLKSLKSMKAEDEMKNFSNDKVTLPQGPPSDKVLDNALANAAAKLTTSAPTKEMKDLTDTIKKLQDQIATATTTAATTPAPTTTTAATTPAPAVSPVVDSLEQKIKKLEAELAAKDNTTTAKPSTTQAYETKIATPLVNPEKRKDGQKVVAMVAGDLVLEVTDPKTFLENNKTTTPAVQQAIADMAKVDLDYVLVQLSSPKALFKDGKKKRDGNVNAAYMIQVIDQAKRGASSVAADLSKMDIKTVSFQVGRAVKIAGLVDSPGDVQAVSLGVTTLPVGTGADGTGGTDALEDPLEDSVLKTTISTTSQTTTTAKPAAASSVQVASVSPHSVPRSPALPIKDAMVQGGARRLDGKVKAPTGAQPQVETAVATSGRKVGQSKASMMALSDADEALPRQQSALKSSVMQDSEETMEDDESTKTMRGDARAVRLSLASLAAAGLLMM